ncbi:MAG: pteridine reductase [Roseiflexaceae bacterium]
MPASIDLRGKAALVTGGVRRLGRASALALAEAGADLLIHTSQAPEQAATTLAELQAHGVRAHVVQGDLAIPADCERIVDRAVELYGRLDILVNNAGIWGPTPIDQPLDLERWDALFHTNLRGVFLVTQRAAVALRSAHGAVINIADVGVYKPFGDHPAYLATKGGIVALTTALARDLAPQVRVNAVAPGPVLMPDDWTPEQSAGAARGTLLKRIGRAEDIGQAVRFLASAEYITGVILPVDGGYLRA